MQEISCTVTGNAVSDVRSALTRTGHHHASFRLASTLRRFDREAGRWTDVETTYLTVSCWRTLADHVVASVHKGDPVVVAGRLRVREWTDGDRQGTHVDIEARSVGHDLSHGVTRFERLRRMSAIADGGAPAPDARELADVDADAGACASGPVSDPGDASAA